MQYDIDRACGHEDTVQIYGTNVNGERDRKAEWYATEDCRDCVRKRRQMDRDAASAVAMRVADDEGWPQLVGSVRQVGWAHSIRLDIMDKLPLHLRKRCDGHISDDLFDEFCDAMCAEALKQTSASWWIAHHERMIQLVRALQPKIDHELMDRVKASWS